GVVSGLLPGQRPSAGAGGFPPVPAHHDRYGERGDGGCRTVCTIRMMFSVLIFRFPSDRGGWPKPGCEAQKTPSVKAGGPFRRCGYSLRRFSTHIRCRRCRDPAWLGNTPRSMGCYTPHPAWPGCSSCTAAAAEPTPPGPAPHSGPQCPQAVILALVMSPSTEVTPPSAVGRRECSGSGRLL